MHQLRAPYSAGATPDNADFSDGRASPGQGAWESVFGDPLDFIEPAGSFLGAAGHHDTEGAAAHILDPAQTEYAIAPDPIKRITKHSLLTLGIGV